MVVMGWSGTIHAGPIFGTNLIMNGNAEGGAGSTTGFQVIRPVPGWTPAGNFTVVQYGIGGGFPSTTDPGPVNRGSNFFAGGPDNASSNASQVIDVSMGAATIDAGGVTFALNGFLGGYDGQRDNAVLSAFFKDGMGGTLGSALIGPVTEPERGGLTGLLFRSTAGTVPLGTRAIDIQLQMTRLDGAYNDGYADNLSLVLNGPAVNAIPEPTSLALAASGILGLIGYRRWFGRRTA
jgi:hypothetical protein